MVTILTVDLTRMTAVEILAFSCPSCFAKKLQSLLKWQWGLAAKIILGCAMGISSSFLAGAQPAAGAAPDSVTAETKRKLTIFPVASYSPETSFSFGAKGIYVIRPAGSYVRDRPTSYSLTFFYTLKQQIISSLRADIWQNHNRDHWQGTANFNDYPYVFFGIGNKAPESAEENYTSLSWDGFVQYERRVSPKIYVGGRYDFRHEELTETEASGMLAAGVIEGSTGTRASGLGPTLSYDTRNHLYTPRKGAYHQASVQAFGKALGGSTSFNRYTLDFRKYFPAPGRAVVAVQAQFTATSGKVPFQYLAAIGGSTLLRGYLNARYRDRHAEVFQAEYRLPLFWRIGVVAFAAAGKVAPDFSQLVPTSLHPAGGLGVRYRLNDEGINLRVDAALSKSMPAVYFSLYEAF